MSEHTNRHITHGMVNEDRSVVVSAEGYNAVIPPEHRHTFDQYDYVVVETQGPSLGGFVSGMRHVDACRWVWRLTDEQIDARRAEAIEALGNSLPSYDAPPPRPAEGNLEQHAWDELNRRGMLTADGDFYGGMTGRAVLELLQVFANQDHSGASAAIVLDLFTRLARFEALSPLTDDPDEWVEVTDDLWQSRRLAEAFSTDGGKTYHLNSDRDTVHTSKKAQP